MEVSKVIPCTTLSSDRNGTLTIARLLKSNQIYNRPLLIVVVTINRGPQYTLQHATITIWGTPKLVRLSFGIPPPNYQSFCCAIEKDHCSFEDGVFSAGRDAGGFSRLAPPNIPLFCSPPPPPQLIVHPNLLTMNISSFEPIYYSSFHYFQYPYTAPTHYSSFHFVFHYPAIYERKVYNQRNEKAFLASGIRG